MLKETLIRIATYRCAREFVLTTTSHEKKFQTLHPELGDARKYFDKLNELATEIEETIKSRKDFSEGLMARVRRMKILQDEAKRVAAKRSENTDDGGKEEQHF